MVVRAVKDGRKPSEKEARLLAIFRAAAEKAEPKPTNVDLAFALDVAFGGTVTEMTRRLEDMGLITVKRWQRSSQICFPDGTCTAAPANQAPHWRTRPKDVPHPSPDVVRGRSRTVADKILRRASELGKPAAEYLADLVFIGWEVEKERG